MEECYFAANLLKVTLLHECFLRFSNCTNGTKSRNITYLVYSIPAFSNYQTGSDLEYWGSARYQQKRALKISTPPTQTF